MTDERDAASPLGTATREIAGAGSRGGIVAAAAIAGIAGLALHATMTRQPKVRKTGPRLTEEHAPVTGDRWKDDGTDMAKALKPERELDRITRIKAWGGTVALTVACAFGVQAMAPDYRPGRTPFPSEPAAPVQTAQAKPVMLKQGVEIMIVASMDEGEIGGAKPMLDGEGRPTGQTRWVKPQPMTLNIRRFVDGEIEGESDDPGVDFDLTVPRSCSKAARTMIGHGVRVPTTWWRVPSSDPQAIVDQMQTTHRRDGLVEAVCEDGPVEATDRQGGIPAQEAVTPADGDAAPRAGADGKSAS